jgi:hypothetical protein
MRSSPASGGVRAALVELNRETDFVPLVRAQCTLRTSRRRRGACRRVACGIWLEHEKKTYGKNCYYVKTIGVLLNEHVRWQLAQCLHHGPTSKPIGFPGNRPSCH